MILVNQELTTTIGGFYIPAAGPKFWYIKDSLASLVSFIRERVSERSRIASAFALFQDRVEFATGDRVHERHDTSTHGSTSGASVLLYGVQLRDH